MSIMRSAILAGARSAWLRQNAPRLPFVRRTAVRFMPGEQLPDALEAARVLAADGVTTLVTHLGENISDEEEARAETQVYLDIIDRIREMRLPCEPSIKLTQLGLDLSTGQCYGNLMRIIQHASPETMVWIDMESSFYVDITLELFRRVRGRYPNVGVCLQAYLFRTEKDLAALMPLGPAIRLVKGAYQEPPDRAIPRKADVDANYFNLARVLLGRQARQAGAKPAFATHDHALIQAINAVAAESGVPKDGYEFQMLYGIRREEQKRLAQEGYRSKVLITYGSAWFPWFMRRLAERPANVLFVLRNLFSK